MKIIPSDKILILGATGLLGSTLFPYLKSKRYDVMSHSRNAGSNYQVDLANLKKTNELLDDIQPDVIVNLVGLTDVEQCEENPNLAYTANVHVIENVTKWIVRNNCSCHFIQVSTDQVYDDANFHVEEFVTLKNYYAFSKYTGELVAAGVNSTILRTNFFGFSHCANRVSLSDWLFRSLTNGENIKIFDDVLFNPLSINTLVKMLELIIQIKPIGVFNLGSKEGMSKADFAILFADELNYSTNTMTRTTTEQVSFLKTYRPKDMRMNCDKIEKKLNIKLPYLKDEIKLVAKEYL